MSRKTIVIATGGTGGHLYPAQAFAKEFLEKSSENRLFFIGGGLKSNRCFDPFHFSFKEIPILPILSKHPLKFLKGAFSHIKGIRDSLRFYEEVKPNLLVGFGSYHSLAPLLAAKWRGIPIILHEANSKPGLANRWLGSLAESVGVHFPSAATYFGKKAIEVPLPTRVSVRIAKEEARAFYGIDPTLKTLLIFGGSQGAEAINRLMEEAAPLLKEGSLQLLHFTGSEKRIDSLKRAYEAAGLPAVVKAFESEMAYAWSAADFFLGRAGASTLAEATHFAVPGLVIPYPYALQHQEENGRFFEEQIKGGIVLIQSTLNPLKLAEEITLFLKEARIKRFHQELLKDRNKPSRISLVDLVETYLKK